MSIKSKILGFFNRKKPTGSLPVNHVFTFETGEKLYTYRPEDYQKIHSRYYKGVQEATNYIQTFVMTKSDWLTAVDKCIESLEYSLSAKQEKLRTKSITEVLIALSEFKKKASGLKNADQALLEELFCMFYLLDDETSTGYSDKHNKRKIELLEADPLMADFFLTNLKQNLKDYYPISEESIEAVLIAMHNSRSKMYSDFQKKSLQQMQ